MSQPIVWKGRGAVSNPQGRFEKLGRVTDEDAYWEPDEDAPETEIKRIAAKGIISQNESPDVSFNQSINPYQGCEHGCIYCFARPSHSYLGLSPGLDFETKIFAKTNAAALLRQELSKPSYRCETIVIGANTDPYQPIERELKITRSLLEVAAEFKQPIGIITKSALVERDLDLLGPMAEEGLARVFVSVTSLDAELARKLEPRAAAPYRRLRALKALADAGVPCGVMTAPIIPFLNDCDMEAILEAAAEAGVDSAGYVLLRLPHELKGLFRDWLQEHFPLRAEHIMARVRDMRGGKDYDSEWSIRQRGVGNYAQLLQQRFDKACTRLGLNRTRMSAETTKFRVPGRLSQLDLF
ncbi:MAG TPA: PA0069 family radical SAM protein [Burkholderiales bacterium]|nr:PA0069 family radical SAM protein [Burkholderiales bacterium]